ncbi:MAG: choice-of-anchor Q domain-containing protein [Caldilineaceae bacterium]
MLLLLESVQLASAAPNSNQTVNNPCTANVAEAAGYTLVYQLDIPTNSDYTDDPVPYTVDNAAAIDKYDRVAYCLELDDQWVWVSMDDFTDNIIAHTGVPVRSVNPAGFQQFVENMNVYSNVPGIVTGDHIATGNIEFWQNCYNRPGHLELQGANNDLYDFDDTINNDVSCDGWGSMQVHNYGASQTVFAYSAWDDAQVDAVGIGNNPTAEPDWTFSENAEAFTTRTLWIFVTSDAEPIYYVDAAATGSATGDSWSNAYVNLQDALQVAVSGDQIWVAQGVYYPDVGSGQTDDDANVSFTIPSGVALFGGFAGSETSLEQRNWALYPTILSGDIGQDDTTDGNGVVASSNNINGSNSYHVLYLDGSTTAVTETTVIDGFIITAGSANGDEFATLNGGGLFCQGDTGECSPTITKVIFSGNAAGDSGGAIKNNGVRGISNPSFVDVIFRGNSAKFGGALHNDGRSSGVSSPSLVNVVFSGNSATNWGGAIVNEAANGASSPLLTNVTFSGNRAAAGGAVYSRGEGGTSSPTLKNVILWQNSAAEGASLFNNNANLTILNSIIEGGSGGIATEGPSAIAYTGNSQSDPLFVQPVDPASAPTSGGDLQLKPQSPAIDTGDSSALPASITTDVAGNQRVSNGTVDLGAYELQQIELSLAEPEHLYGLIANLEATMQPVVHYTGYDELAYSLTESPDNMTIDLSTGLIRWTPQEADEGQSYAVTVSVNDGSHFAEIRFQITVLAPAPLAVEIVGNVLTVVDPSTTLNGMTITQLDGEPRLADLNLGKLSAAVTPATPAWVTLFSDVFVVRGTFDAEVELRFPLMGLPENITQGDVDLYGFINALDVEGQFWSPTWVGIEYEGTAEAPVMVVRLSGLEGMAAWGYDASREESSTSLETIQNATAPRRVGLAAPLPQQATVACTAQNELHICKTAEVTVTIKGWGPSATRWWGSEQPETGATKEQLVSWLLNAQTWFLGRGLGFNKTFNVDIGEMPSSPNGQILGYVASGIPEKGNTLHLNHDNTISRATMQGTAVHEYFHHAQFHPNTKVDNKNVVGSSWLIEGTARWFEDELFDNLNTYTLKEGIGYRIAEAGINSDNGTGVKRPYQRFSFFKLLTQSCPNFTAKFRTGLNTDLTTDPSGIRNITDLFGSNAFACGFGGHLGAARSSSLAAALVYYNYVTQFKDQISLLDTNESDSGFHFDNAYNDYNPVWLTSAADWVASPDYQPQLVAPTYIPAVGAYSFVVPAITGELPADKVAELVIESSGPLTVSITSADTRFTGTNTIGNHGAPHTWFSTAEQTSYLYSANGAVPALFVTLVNPSLQDTVRNVKVTFRISDKSMPDLSITSPQNGALVSNRVITVTGAITEAGHLSTTKVTVFANGIAADAPVNPDGSFVVQVVVALGENIIKAQGFSSNSTPTTKEKVLTVQGVASASSEPNALIASRAVFVLRWDTSASDIDIYATDKAGGSVWFDHKIEGPGTLDFDDRDGFGPEVISYRATDDEIYVDGAFDVDVHYYEGSPATNFTLDVILNETEAANRRIRQYRSAKPLVTANADQSGPDGAGDSRFNNILRVSCSPQRVCNLANVDSASLISSGSAAMP